MGRICASKKLYCFLVEVNKYIKDFSFMLFYVILGACIIGFCNVFLFLTFRLLCLFKKRRDLFEKNMPFSSGIPGSGTSLLSVM